MKATADLCDQYGDRVRVMPPVLRHFGGRKRFSGKVYTVMAPDDNTLVRAALERDGAGQVLLVDGRASVNCALLGDQLAELAVRNSWAGVIVNGCIRDAQALAQLPLGVMARASFPRKSLKLGRGESGISLEIEGLTIQAGDYVLVDEDGVIFADEDLAN